MAKQELDKLHKKANKIGKIMYHEDFDLKFDSMDEVSAILKFESFHVIFN